MKTTLVLSPRYRRRLHDRALRAQRRDQSEVCGALIVTSTDRLELRFLANRAGGPGRFSLRQVDLARVRSALRGTGKRVVGTFHSHPIGYATPGQRDRRAGRPGSLMLIYDVCGRELKFWRLGRQGRRVVASAVQLSLKPQKRSSRQPSNNRLKLTARGRSVGAWRLPARAASYPGRWAD